MRYVESRLEQYERETMYRYYVSDSLQLAPQVKWKLYTLKEIYHPETIKVEKTGEEIVSDVMAGAGLKFG